MARVVGCARSGFGRGASLISSVLLRGVAIAFFVIVVRAAEIARRDLGERLPIGLARSFGVVGVSITSPDAGVFGACEVIGTVLPLWVAATSIQLVRVRDAPVAYPAT